MHGEDVQRLHLRLRLHGEHGRVPHEQVGETEDEGDAEDVHEEARGVERGRHDGVRVDATGCPGKEAEDEGIRTLPYSCDEAEAGPLASRGGE